ncbi:MULTISPECIES: sugar-transfer associated ATP-grasp domain-containing protein [Hwangdonia]|uniref:Sugar-transfer associated ATP-grasp domain-containing protein n=1 Tax=Hwangdonia seohaensis TaxID=1240727 RepID=A0ABW3RB26_9FLAO|nr:sugar-transfer associated ATP-grasp domain-containing protein [Hwangdonia seohaensis]
MLSRIKNLNVFLNDSDKKSFLKIIKEVIHFSWIKKALPTDYFRKYLYRRDVTDYTSYLSFKEYNSILSSKQLVFPEISALLNNKLSFSLLCKTNHIKTPKLFSYHIKNRFYFNDKIFVIHTENDLLSFFENVFETQNIDALFLKPLQGIGGQGCILLNKNNLKNKIQHAKKSLLKASYLHQECIEQHTEINKIHAKSINTLRCVTYIDKENKIHIVSIFMRFGVGNSVTDNVTSGGFYIAVNTETGVLQGQGRQSVVMGGNVFNNHPNSNFKLDGFKIPYFTEACDLVKYAALYFPSRIIGWDVAITHTGPIIIEGNHNPDLQTSDTAYGGYCKSPIIKEILKEINTLPA